MLDALLQEKMLEAGSVQNYAAKLGINNATLWRYAYGNTDLLSDRKSEARLAIVESLVIPKSGLEQLATYTVSQGCKRILE
jgi:hypothetical protein